MRAQPSQTRTTGDESITDLVTVLDVPITRQTENIPRRCTSNTRETVPSVSVRVSTVHLGQVQISPFESRAILANGTNMVLEYGLLFGLPAVLIIEPLCLVISEIAFASVAARRPPGGVYGSTRNISASWKT